MKASWVWAVVITVLFFISQWGWGRVLGYDAATGTETTDGLWTGMVFRVGLTALIFTAIALYLSRIWGGGIYVQHVPRLPAWMWVLPLVMLAAAVVGVVVNDWGARGMDYVLVLALGTLIVGIAEETTFRGIVVRALRGSTSNEFLVMLFSALLFGVIHAVNILNGAEVGKTIGQVAIASISGIALYVTLRLTGSLLVPILLHGFYDYSVIGTVGDPAGAQIILTFLMYGLSIIFAIVILVMSMRKRGEPQAVAAA